MTQGPPADLKMQRTSRDASTVPGLLEGWLAGLLPEGADPRVTLHSGIDANGMSSETLVLDAAWTEDGQPREGKYVARVAPSAADVPVFSSYDLQEQYDAIKHVGDHTDVPVPAVGFMEPTGDVLGTPFFLMDRIEGIVPPDVMPYTFGDNWLFDASPEEQRLLQDSSVGVLAGLHAIPDAAATFAYLDPGRHLTGAAATGTPMERNLAARRAWYEFAVPDLGRSPMVEKILDWLEANQPADPGDTVLSWGDARIGNMMYRDFDAGRRPRLGDGDHRAAGARRVVDGLLAPGLRVDRDAVRAAGDAALHARGGRGRDVRAAHRRRGSAS